MAQWLFTATGRRELADGANRATQALQFTRLLVGDQGAAPEAGPVSIRTALRRQRESVPLVGTTAVDGRIAVRGDWTPASAYDVLETGIMARVGTAAEFLALYWSDTAPLLRTTPGALATVAGAIDLVAASAEVTVTLSPTIQIVAGPRTFVGLLDTPGAIAPGRVVTGGAGGTLQMTEDAGRLLRSAIQTAQIRLTSARRGTGAWAEVPGGRVTIPAAAVSGGAASLLLVTGYVRAVHVDADYRIRTLAAGEIWRIRPDDEDSWTIAGVARQAADSAATVVFEAAGNWLVDGVTIDVVRLG